MNTRVPLTRGLESLFGTHDENLRLLESALRVTVQVTEDALVVEGSPEGVERCRQILEDYSALIREGHAFNAGDLQGFLRVVTDDPSLNFRDVVVSGKQRNFGRRAIQAKSATQRRYMEAIDHNDMVFGVGPAGTGKTYLAVAMAVAALLSRRVNRIVLARPAVEAGERLGFLPGTLQEKVDPYMRPIYDSLYDLLDAEKVERYLERRIIEVAPVAFMRGRTLNDSFVILDEAQNTTSEQMKMFLTRLGFNSKAVVTGDVTQIDLPTGKRSGLLDAIDVVSGIEGTSFVYFNDRDVVRHTLVQRIIKAYDAHDKHRHAGAIGGVGGAGAAGAPPSGDGAEAAATSSPGAIPSAQ